MAESYTAGKSANITKIAGSLANEVVTTATNSGSSIDTSVTTEMYTASGMFLMDTVTTLTTYATGTPDIKSVAGSTTVTTSATFGAIS